jgi:hypothetical protein
MRIPLLRSILFATLFFICAISNAQQVLTTAHDSLKKDSVYKALFNRRGKTIFFEAAGPGALYSINYDVRFNKRQNGFGIRAGISYFPNENEHLITVPVIVNYLAGKKGHYLELGAGLTFFHIYSRDNIFFYNDNNEFNPYPVGYQYELQGETGAIGSLTAGYRYQPLKGGFTFRIGGGPIVTTKKQFLLWPYASFGYSFKNKPKAKK